ncbi:hypothetical protein HYH03_005217 [Edaphochlamys debaryana]|uniref:Uncharacterized protein n=1 Tax=Edaphochlamys debaryana TaxID=47281 RepID=A0A836C1J2_9CHLO|nr:hypothetical protein HYH03_005217 [Edaphochlamys debaryana]|eukprot:KAG2496810.1 hypothetical protein HYH03_005217 [Edaphochlamys debaryana]
MLRCAGDAAVAAAAAQGVASLGPSPAAALAHWLVTLPAAHAAPPPPAFTGPEGQAQAAEALAAPHHSLAHSPPGQATCEPVAAAAASHPAQSHTPVGPGPAPALPSPPPASAPLGSALLPWPRFGSRRSPPRPWRQRLLRQLLQYGNHAPPQLPYGSTAPQHGHAPRGSGASGLPGGSAPCGSAAAAPAHSMAVPVVRIWPRAPVIAVGSVSELWAVPTGPGYLPGEGEGGRMESPGLVVRCAVGGLGLEGPRGDAEPPRRLCAQTGDGRASGGDSARANSAAAASDRGSPGSGSGGGRGGRALKAAPASASRELKPRSSSPPRPPQLPPTREQLSAAEAALTSAGLSYAMAVRGQLGSQLKGPASLVQCLEAGMRATEAAAAAAAPSASASTAAAAAGVRAAVEAAMEGSDLARLEAKAARGQKQALDSCALAIYRLVDLLYDEAGTTPGRQIARIAQERSAHEDFADPPPQGLPPPGLGSSPRTVTQQSNARGPTRALFDADNAESAPETSPGQVEPPASQNPILSAALAPLLGRLLPPLLSAKRDALTRALIAVDAAVLNDLTQVPTAASAADGRVGSGDGSAGVTARPAGMPGAAPAGGLLPAAALLSAVEILQASQAAVQAVQAPDGAAAVEAATEGGGGGSADPGSGRGGPGMARAGEAAPAAPVLPYDAVQRVMVSLAEAAWRARARALASQTQDAARLGAPGPPQPAPAGPIAPDEAAGWLVLAGQMGLNPNGTPADAALIEALAGSWRDARGPWDALAGSPDGDGSGGRDGGGAVVSPAMARLVVRSLLRMGWYDERLYDRLVDLGRRRADGSYLGVPMPPKDPATGRPCRTPVFMPDQLLLAVRYGNTKWASRDPYDSDVHEPPPPQPPPTTTTPPRPPPRRRQERPTDALLQKYREDAYGIPYGEPREASGSQASGLGAGSGPAPLVPSDLMRRALLAAALPPAHDPAHACLSQLAAGGAVLAEAVRQLPPRSPVSEFERLRGSRRWCLLVTAWEQLTALGIPPPPEAAEPLVRLRLKIETGPARAAAGHRSAGRGVARAAAGSGAAKADVAGRAGGAAAEDGGSGGGSESDALTGAASPSSQRSGSDPAQLPAQPAAQTLETRPLEAVVSLAAPPLPAAAPHDLRSAAHQAPPVMAGAAPQPLPLPLPQPPTAPPQQPVPPPSLPAPQHRMPLAQGLLPRPRAEALSLPPVSPLLLAARVLTSASATASALDELPACAHVAAEIRTALCTPLAAALEQRLLAAPPLAAKLPARCRLSAAVAASSGSAAAGSGAPTAPPPPSDGGAGGGGAGGGLAGGGSQGRGGGGRDGEGPEHGGAGVGVEAAEPTEAAAEWQALKRRWTPEERDEAGAVAQLLAERTAGLAAATHGGGSAVSAGGSTSTGSSSMSGGGGVSHGDGDAGVPLTPLQAEAVRLLPAMRPADVAAVLAALRAAGLPPAALPSGAQLVASRALTQGAAELSTPALVDGIRSSLWLAGLAAVDGAARSRPSPTSAAAAAAGAAAGAAGGGEPPPAVLALGDELAARATAAAAAGAKVAGSPAAVDSAAAADEAAAGPASRQSPALTAFLALASAGIRHERLLLAAVGAPPSAAADADATLPPAAADAATAAAAAEAAGCIRKGAVHFLLKSGALRSPEDLVLLLHVSACALPRLELPPDWPFRVGHTGKERGTSQEDGGLGTPGESSGLGEPSRREGKEAVRTSPAERLAARLRDTLEPVLAERQGEVDGGGEGANVTTQSGREPDTGSGVAPRTPSSPADGKPGEPHGQADGAQLSASADRGLLAAPADPPPPLPLSVPVRALAELQAHVAPWTSHARASPGRLARLRIRLLTELERAAAAAAAGPAAAAAAIEALAWWRRRALHVVVMEMEVAVASVGDAQGILERRVQHLDHAAAALAALLTAPSPTAAAALMPPVEAADLASRVLACSRRWTKILERAISKHHVVAAEWEVARAEALVEAQQKAAEQAKGRAGKGAKGARARAAGAPAEAEPGAARPSAERSASASRSANDQRSTVAAERLAAPPAELQPERVRGLEAAIEVRRRRLSQLRTQLVKGLLVPLPDSGFMEALGRHAVQLFGRDGAALPLRQAPPSSASSSSSAAAAADASAEGEAGAGPTAELGSLFVTAANTTTTPSVAPSGSATAAAAAAEAEAAADVAAGIQEERESLGTGLRAGGGQDSGSTDVFRAPALLAALRPSAARHGCPPAIGFRSEVLEPHHGEINRRLAAMLTSPTGRGTAGSSGLEALQRVLQMTQTRVRVVSLGLQEALKCSLEEQLPLASAKQLQEVVRDVRKSPFVPPHIATVAAQRLVKLYGDLGRTAAQSSQSLNTAEQPPEVLAAATHVLSYLASVSRPLDLDRSLVQSVVQITRDAAQKNMAAAAEQAASSPSDGEEQLALSSVRQISSIVRNAEAVCDQLPPAARDAVLAELDPLYGMLARSRETSLQAVFVGVLESSPDRRPPLPLLQLCVGLLPKLCSSPGLSSLVARLLEAAGPHLAGTAPGPPHPALPPWRLADSLLRAADACVPTVRQELVEGLAGRGGLAEQVLLLPSSELMTLAARSAPLHLLPPTSLAAICRRLGEHYGRLQPGPRPLGSKARRSAVAESMELHEATAPVGPPPASSALTGVVHAIRRRMLTSSTAGRSGPGGAPSTAAAAAVSHEDPPEASLAVSYALSAVLAAETDGALTLTPQARDLAGAAACDLAAQALTAPPVRSPAAAAAAVVAGGGPLLRRGDSDATGGLAAAAAAALDLPPPGAAADLPSSPPPPPLGPPPSWQAEVAAAGGSPLAELKRWSGPEAELQLLQVAVQRLWPGRGGGGGSPDGSGSPDGGGRAGGAGLLLLHRLLTSALARRPADSVRPGSADFPQEGGGGGGGSGAVAAEAPTAGPRLTWLLRVTNAVLAKPPPPAGAHAAAEAERAYWERAAIEEHPGQVAEAAVGADGAGGSVEAEAAVWAADQGGRTCAKALLGRALTEVNDQRRQLDEQLVTPLVAAQAELDAVGPSAAAEAEVADAVGSGDGSVLGVPSGALTAPPPEPTATPARDLDLRRLGGPGPGGQYGDLGADPSKEARVAAAAAATAGPAARRQLLHHVEEYLRTLVRDPDRQLVELLAPPPPRPVWAAAGTDYSAAPTVAEGGLRPAAVPEWLRPGSARRPDLATLYSQIRRSPHGLHKGGGEAVRNMLYDNVRHLLDELEVELSNEVSYGSLRAATAATATTVAPRRAELLVPTTQVLALLHDAQAGPLAAIVADGDGGAASAAGPRRQPRYEELWDLVAPALAAAAAAGDLTPHEVVAVLERLKSSAYPGPVLPDKKASARAAPRAAARAAAPPSNAPRLADRLLQALFPALQSAALSHGASAAAEARARQPSGSAAGAEGKAAAVRLGPNEALRLYQRAAAALRALGRGDASLLALLHQAFKPVRQSQEARSRAMQAVQLARALYDTSPGGTAPGDAGTVAEVLREQLAAVRQDLLSYMAKEPAQWGVDTLSRMAAVGGADAAFVEGACEILLRNSPALRPSAAESLLSSLARASAHDPSSIRGPHATAMARSVVARIKTDVALVRTTRLAQTLAAAEQLAAVGSGGGGGGGDRALAEVLRRRLVERLDQPDVPWAAVSGVLKELAKPSVRPPPRPQPQQHPELQQQAPSTAGGGPGEQALGSRSVAAAAAAEDQGSRQLLRAVADAATRHVAAANKRAAAVSADVQGGDEAAELGSRTAHEAEALVMATQAMRALTALGYQHIYGSGAGVGGGVGGGGGLGGEQGAGAAAGGGGGGKGKGTGGGGGGSRGQGGAALCSALVAEAEAALDAAITSLLEGRAMGPSPETVEQARVEAEARSGREGKGRGASALGGDGPVRMPRSLDLGVILELTDALSEAGALHRGMLNRVGLAVAEVLEAACGPGRALGDGEDEEDGDGGGEEGQEGGGSDEGDGEGRGGQRKPKHAPRPRPRDGAAGVGLVV